MRARRRAAHADVSSEGRTQAPRASGARRADGAAGAAPASFFRAGLTPFDAAPRAARVTGAAFIFESHPPIPFSFYFTDIVFTLSESYGMKILFYFMLFFFQDYEFLTVAIPHPDEGGCVGLVCVRSDPPDAWDRRKGSRVCVGGRG